MNVSFGQMYVEAMDGTILISPKNCRHEGFIAQDVEQVMKELGIPFRGLKKSDDGTYSLAYPDFVMPLVNIVKRS